MAKSSLITVVNYRSRQARVIKELVDALETTTGHHHDGTNSRSVTATVTLDGAYDSGGVGAGRAITVNDGAVTMTKTDAGTENVLEVSASPSAGAAGSPLRVINGTNSTGAGISFANAGSGADILGTSSTWSVTAAGLGSFTNVALLEGTVPGGTVVYVARDNTGDLTLNALAGKAVNIAVAGTDVVAVASTGLTITGNLTVSGTFGISGNWDVAATLTADELILDTDGVAPAGTNAYVVSDNVGDLTVNALTGKTFNIAVNSTDEYTFSATIADFLGNAIDNAGYVILNAATAPAGTEVYLVNDNTGDLTLNALNTKSVHIAIASTDEYSFSATALALATNNLTLSTGNVTFSGAGFVDLGATGYLIAGTAANATGKIRLANNTWISAENAAGAGNVNMISVNASDLVAFGANLAALTMGATLSFAAQSISGTTGNVTLTGAGYLSIGANPSGTGYVRLSNAVAISWRNAANGADITALTVNASDDVALGADLQMGANVIYGDTASGGNLVLHSTLHATKGFIGIPTGHEGLKIGGTVDRATIVGDNVLHIFNGAAAPSGTLANGISLYSEAGECKVLDAAGNSTTLSPHTSDGDYVIHSYSVKKDETVTIHVEKLLKALATTPELRRFVVVNRGQAARPLPV